MAGTSERMVAVLNDIEILSRELFEEATCKVTTGVRSEGCKTALLLDSLIEQDIRLKDLLKRANEQAAVQSRIDLLNIELEKRNNDIIQLQKSLKDAETVLASAVFEANKKLAAVRNAEEKAISAEDLIRFAHRISASGAVAAPPTWAPGDPSRRPYPTDTEMRQGFLCKNFQTLLTQSSQQTTQSLSSLNQNDSGSMVTNPYSWHYPGSSDRQPSATPTLSHQINIKDNDVELMSPTDSSSSSSSDEQ